LKHAHHFPQASGAVLKEHQAELADGRVEAFVGERNVLGATLAWPPEWTCTCSAVTFC
jgi:hypothetical protein